MTDLAAAIRWHRLDVPGTDECRVQPHAGGWRLSGLAEFGTGNDAASLEYLVEADAAWRTLRGEVRGRAGARPVDLTILRSADGNWQVNGTAEPALAGLVDLDLGFTPATNLFPVRRLALEVGDAADAAAAWLDDESWAFRRLPQRYERRGAREYWYESPSTGYRALLTVAPTGFVLDYPGLWRAVERGEG